jgi:hypothetical protein
MTALETKPCPQCGKAAALLVNKRIVRVVLSSRRDRFGRPKTDVLSSQMAFCSEACAEKFQARHDR